MNSIALSRKQFNDLKQMVYRISGINLHEGKLELLKSKIAKRLKYFFPDPLCQFSFTLFKLINEF